MWFPCPWHDLAFDVRNGQGTDGGGYCVGSYDVRVEDGQIFVGCQTEGLVARNSGRGRKGIYESLEQSGSDRH